MIHFSLLLVIAVWGLVFLGLNWDDVDFEKMRGFKPDGPLTIGMLLYGFSAAFLGITGFESAAQIVEELEEPTMVTVRKLYKIVVILVSLTAPAISFLCLALLSQEQIDTNLNYLLSGLANKLGGRPLAFILVIDAMLTLFAATNTAFVGFIGLATTMSKQGNLPQFLLYRVAHKYPNIQGYPLIALPFMVIAMMMSALVAGEVEIVAKVYEIAFLGVMVSFCIGVVLLRNRDHRRDTPEDYLSNWILMIERRKIPVVPLFSGLVLAFACMQLVSHASNDALLMLTVLFFVTLLGMAYYRWGELERRLERRHDLRLGLGQFSLSTELPEDLKRYVLCAGGTGVRSLINRSLRQILRNESNPFELIIFHAEDGKDNEGFFYESLQRVVSQQIAPVYNKDIILTVKILPGSLSEGLHTLKKTVNFHSVLFGSGRNPEAGHKLAEEISEALEVEVIHL